MNIKRFIAQNAQEAIKMVKKEMGSEAIILRTRTILEGSERSQKKDGSTWKRNSESSKRQCYALMPGHHSHLRSITTRS